MMNGILHIACLVEGEGEVAAFPVLIRNYAAEINRLVDVLRPIRVPRAKFLKSDGKERERALELCWKLLKEKDGAGAIIVLLDSDDDCPAILGPELQKLMDSTLDGRVRGKVVLAQREYESWFLISAHSCAGKRRLPENLVVPEHPEEIRGCKEWLTRQMPSGVIYKETTDQAALTAALDFKILRSHSKSFQKLTKELDFLFGSQ